MNLNGKRIVIAKTNHIGDVVISLPMAGLIKEHYPKARVIFINRAEVCDISRLCRDVDETYDWNEIIKTHDPVSALKALKADIFIHTNPCSKMASLAKRAEIPLRIGSLFRLYHWWTCNRLAFISRNPTLNKRSLDLAYLNVLGLPTKFTEKKLSQLCQLNCLPLSKSHRSFLSTDKFNLVLHPGANTAKEDCWSIDNYKQLIRALDKTKFNILISGINSERAQFSPLLKEDGVIDLMGRMSLSHYFNFLHYIDGLVAGSTGPLHMASAQKKNVLGLYKHNQRDIKRWGPMSNHASCVLSDKKGVNAISVERVRAHLADWVI